MYIRFLYTMQVADIKRHIHLNIKKRVIKTLCSLHTTQVADIPESPPRTYGMYHGFFFCCGTALLLAMVYINLLNNNKFFKCEFGCCANYSCERNYNLIFCYKLLFEISFFKKKIRKT